jgi:hypothetical protein
MFLEKNYADIRSTEASRTLRVIVKFLRHTWSLFDGSLKIRVRGLVRCDSVREDSVCSSPVHGHDTGIRNLGVTDRAASATT